MGTEGEVVHVLRPACDSSLLPDSQRLSSASTLTCNSSSDTSSSGTVYRDEPSLDSSALPSNGHTKNPCESPDRDIESAPPLSASKRRPRSFPALTEKRRQSERDADAYRKERWADRERRTKERSARGDGRDELLRVREDSLEWSTSCS